MTKIEQAKARGRALLDLAGLKDWKIGTFFAYHKLATTNHFSKLITYNERFIERATEEEFDQVTIHEIAHALIGMGHGHGEKFVKTCERLFPSKAITTSDLDVDIFKYYLVCPTCKSIATTNNTRVQKCGTCLIPYERVKHDVPTVAWATKP